MQKSGKSMPLQDVGFLLMSCSGFFCFPCEHDACKAAGTAAQPDNEVGNLKGIGEFPNKQFPEAGGGRELA